MAKRKKAAKPEIQASGNGWHPGNVSSQSIPKLVYRTYLETSQLRRMISGPFKRVADVGAGFGRLAPVFLEMTSDLVCFEREPAMRREGAIISGTSWPEVEDLKSLPAEDDSFDLVVSYTVLQHMTDEDAQAVLSEMKRICSPGGTLLIAENCDPEDRDRKWAGLFSNGRSVETWEEWVGHPASLTEPRATERQSWRLIEGYVMLFEMPPAE